MRLHASLIWTGLACITLSGFSVGAFSLSNALNMRMLCGHRWTLSALGSDRTSNLINAENKMVDVRPNSYLGREPWQKSGEMTWKTSFARHPRITTGIVSSCLAIGLALGLSTNCAMGANPVFGAIDHSVISTERVIESNIKQDVSEFSRSPGEHDSVELLYFHPFISLSIDRTFNHRMGNGPSEKESSDQEVGRE